MKNGLMGLITTGVLVTGAWLSLSGKSHKTPCIPYQGYHEIDGIGTEYVLDQKPAYERTDTPEAAGIGADSLRNILKIGDQYKFTLKRNLIGNTQIESVVSCK